MKTARIWLLILAAMAITAPLSAEEINAPEPNWDSSTAVESPTVNWARVAEDAQDISQPTPAVAAATPVPLSAAPVEPAIQPAEQNQNQHQKAEQQIKEQEKQRVLGILPAFNVSYRSDAVSLTARQKISLAFRSSTDPITFATAFVAGGYHEVRDDVNFGWGIEGYAKRSGAAYLNAFDGNMIGNGILPSLLHQDPRYFRMGHGNKTRRLLYAGTAAFICKHDNTGKWEPNYSNVGGNIASGAISNLYYPGSNSGIGLTISNGMIVTAEGVFGTVFQEFWPDISRKLFHKDPTHGLDAEAGRAAAPASAAPSANKQ